MEVKPEIDATPGAPLQNSPLGNSKNIPHSAFRTPHSKRSPSRLPTLAVLLLVLAGSALYDVYPWLTRARAFRQVQALAPIGTSWAIARTRLQQAGFRVGPPELSLYTRQSIFVNLFDRLAHTLDAPALYPEGVDGGVGMLDIDTSNTIVGAKDRVVWMI